MLPETRHYFCPLHSGTGFLIEDHFLGTHANEREIFRVQKPRTRRDHAPFVPRQVDPRQRFNDDVWMIEKMLTREGRFLYKGEIVSSPRGIADRILQSGLILTAEREEMIKRVTVAQYQLRNKQRT